LWLSDIFDSDSEADSRSAPKSWTIHDEIHDNSRNAEPDEEDMIADILDSDGEELDLSDLEMGKKQRK
jgi:hypothetical protein